MKHGDLRSAFARAAADGGLMLGSESFDCLCEQGHIGLERVAKARHDPTRLEPVTAEHRALCREWAVDGDGAAAYRRTRELLQTLLAP